MTSLKYPLVFENLPVAPYGDPLFQKDTLTITNPITIFVAPNGYGKTTLFRMLKENLKSRGWKETDKSHKTQRMVNAFTRLITGNDDLVITKAYIAYDAHDDDHTNTMSATSFEGNLEMMGMRMTSSEGQNKLLSMMELFDAAQRTAHLHPELEQIVLFVDGIDSGLSVDMIALIMDSLEVKIQQVESHGVEVAILFTTNNYEVCRGREVTDPRTFETTEYADYPDFRADMLYKSTLKEL